MKPPVKIDELMNEWSKDSTIDEIEPSRETAKIPTLHAKYLRILTHHRLVIRSLQAEYNTLRALKWSYYSGDLNNPEDLEKYNLEPWTKKVLRQDIPIYLDSDKQLNNLLLKKVLHEEIVDFCVAVLKELSARTYQLGNIIRWEIFTSGK